jgi:SAM-dependent methyltransferase
MPPRLPALAFGPPLYALGLGSGLLNRVARQFAEYKPAAYPADDIERSVSHVREICDRWQAALDRLAPGESFAGKRVLELGPGHSLGTGMVLLARGATAYTAVDVFPLVYRSPASLYEALAAAECCPPDLAQQTNFQIVDFPTLEPLAGSFDVTVSNSTLEHVEDIPATFRALRARTRDFMVHHVDAKVHLRVRAIDPLNHLRYNERVYRWMSYKGLPNRLLYLDYERAALAAGFTEVQFTPRSVASRHYVDLVRPTLAPAFRARADLHLLSFTMFAR